MEKLFKKWLEKASKGNVLIDNEIGIQENDYLDFAQYVKDNSWISVEESGYPKGMGDFPCLVNVEGVGVISATFYCDENERGFYTGDYVFIKPVTHWQELPNKPK